MAAGERVEVVAVAAAHHRDERDPSPGRFSDHVGVAAAEPLVGEREPAEPVVHVRVDARVVEDEIGREPAEQAGQVLGERVQVGVVAGPVW